MTSREDILVSMKDQGQCPLSVICLSGEKAILSFYPKVSNISKNYCIYAASQHETFVFLILVEVPEATNYVITNIAVLH